MRDHTVTEWTHPLPPLLMFALHLKKQVLEKYVIRERDKENFWIFEYRSFNLPISRLDAQPLIYKEPGGELSH